MATLHDSAMGPVASPARPSARQASRKNSHVDSSAARCRIFRGQKLNNGQLTSAQSEPTNDLVRNSVNFQYLAGNPLSRVSSSSSNTVRKTTPARQVYGRNIACYFHYLERKIRLINSKIDLYNHDLKNEVVSLNSIISSYTNNLDRKFQLLNDNKDLHAEVVRELQRLKNEQEACALDLDMKIKLLKDSHADIVRETGHLNARKDSVVPACETTVKGCEANKYSDACQMSSQINNQTVGKDSFDSSIDEQVKGLNDKKVAYAHDLDKLRNVKDNSHANDLDRQINLLSVKKGSLARGFIRQVQLLMARIDSYILSLPKRIIRLNDKVTSYSDDLSRQLELLSSKQAPFAHDLDEQLRLLDSKLVSYNQDFRQQHSLLESNLVLYFRDMKEKTKGLRSHITSYLGPDNGENEVVAQSLCNTNANAVTMD